MLCSSALQMATVFVLTGNLLHVHYPRVRQISTPLAAQKLMHDTLLRRHTALQGTGNNSILT